ncbi:hypothetical protein JTB14_029497 [Gonioctena quinquepunctata]|nr:hypothetical protein JTB14_029497 [Gonioctena quinquepunctata]
MPAPSHSIINNALMSGLAEAGHDVTLISPFTEKNTPKNGSWREIILDGFMEEQAELLKKFGPYKKSWYTLLSSLLSTSYVNVIGNRLVEKTFQNPEVQTLLKSNEKFDAVIIGQFMSEGLGAFASHFDAHLIMLNVQEASSWNNQLVGNPSLPSFSSEPVLNYPTNMSLSQRVKNTFNRIWMYLNQRLITYPAQNRLIQKFFPNPIDLEDAVSNMSLILLNSHVSFSKAQAYVPNMIEIGGLHVKPPKKLPDDLQKFLDDAKEGLIYFSMGSNLKSNNLPIEVRDAILEAFGKRKEKILWKWEDDSLPGQPSNVFLKKWVPQQDILAHPNLKVFITHGGLLSNIETVYHGVPLIAIPIFGDQFANADSAKQLGYGLVLPLTDISEEKISSLLDEIISNPTYRENVRARSKVMHDRPMKPLDSAVYWVEYVIRHKGAEHLRVGYRHLTWYQFYLLDVFAVVLGVIFLSLMVFKKILSVCRRKSRISKQKES